MLGPLLSVGTIAKTCRFDVWRSLCTSITSANSVPTCCAAGHTVEALFCRWTGEHEQKTKLGTWGWRRLEPETGPVWLSSPCRLPSFCTSVVSPLLVSMEFTEGAMFQNTTETIARRGHRCADNHTEMLNNLWRGIFLIKSEFFNLKSTFEICPVSSSCTTVFLHFYTVKPPAFGGSAWDEIVVHEVLNPNVKLNQVWTWIILTARGCTYGRAIGSHTQELSSGFHCKSFLMTSHSMSKIWIWEKLKPQKP